MNTELQESSQPRTTHENDEEPETSNQEEKYESDQQESIEKYVTVKGRKMPVIGVSIKKGHLSILQRYTEALLHGARHFELPVNDRIVWRTAAKSFRQHNHNSKKTCNKWDMDQYFFLSTSVSAYYKGGTNVHDLVNNFPPVKMKRKRIDILYLENPVGLRGTDPTLIFKTVKIGFYSNKKMILEIFERDPDTSILKLPTKIQQNLLLLWKRLERELQRKQDSHHSANVKMLGLRNFSAPQIEALVEVAAHQPDVVQAEINAYNMQLELRSLCKSLGIQVIAIHPFGNPNDAEREGMPLLYNHPFVRNVATKLRVHPKIVLLRHLLQSGIPFVFDICEYKPHALFQEIWSTKLNKKHMKLLDALNGNNKQESKGAVKEWLLKDPLWPFYIPSRYKKRKTVQE